MLGRESYIQKQQALPPQAYATTITAATSTAAATIFKQLKQLKLHSILLGTADWYHLILD